MATGKRLGKGLGALFSNYDEELESSLDSIRADEFASPPSMVATSQSEEQILKPAEPKKTEPDLTQVATTSAEPVKNIEPVEPKVEPASTQGSVMPAEPKVESASTQGIKTETKPMPSAIVNPSIISPAFYRQETEPKEGETATKILISDVFPNPNQPRKQFNEEKMSELASSIRVHGVIQPIIVVAVENRYMIIAGERRYRASILVGAKDIPAIIRNYTPLQIKEISLIENLQREDLNPIETANYIKQLMLEYQFTQEVIADRIGKSRSAVANTLRLLSLPPAVLKLVETERLSAGHARALVVVENKDHQYKLAMQACDNKMSVRDLEKAVKKHNKPNAVKEKPQQSIELKELILDMQRALATKVSVIGNDRRGRIYIDYYTSDDLDRINDIITYWQAKK